MNRERRWDSVPRLILFVLIVGITLQTSWHAVQGKPEARAARLPVPPRSALLQVASIGDPELLGRLLMLWLQTFDNQPGISIPFRDLDYSTVIAWLDRVLTLVPRSQYPLLAASHLYAEVPIEAKQRQMLEFVHDKFIEDPNRRWPWLAHAVIIAKHRLHDLLLALRYAKAIAEHASSTEIPSWARQMHIFILEDLQEFESAAVLLGGLLDSGSIKDPKEYRFLAERLQELQSEASKNSP